MPISIKHLDADAQTKKNKEDLRLFKYQMNLFQKEITRLEKQAENRIATQEERAKKMGCKFKSREELDYAYMLGGISDSEYVKQRRKIWNVYSDRDGNAKLKWCREEYEKAKKRHDELAEKMEQLKEVAKQEKERKRKERIRHKHYMRRYRGKQE